MSTDLDRTRASRLGQGPRHPLCPQCRYDLVATVEKRGRLCPECGYAFGMDELVPEVRPGDYTVSGGVRHAALVLLAKATVCIGAWGLVLTLQHLLSSYVQTRSWPRLVTLPISLISGLVVLATGGAVGWVLIRRIDEHLGFAGLAVATVLTGIAIVVLFLGSTLAAQFIGANSLDTMLALLIAGMISTAFIVKKAFLDEQ